jgi:hypothetical protein
LLEILVLMLVSRVNVRIASIASFLPSSEDNNAIFMGTTRGPGTGPVLTPAEETRMRIQQVEVQKQDANDRRIVYSADGLVDEDAEGIDDPDCGGADAINEAPIGMRGHDNSIVPLPENVLRMSRNRAGSNRANAENEDLSAGETEFHVFPGISVDTANHVRQLVSSSFPYLNLY